MTARRNGRGRARTTTRRARSWADRVERRLPGPLRTLVERAREEDILLFAAGLAFYALVSVAPAVILVMWAASLALGDQRVHDLARELARVAPKELGVDTALQRVANLGARVGVAAVVTGLWPATSYGSGLRRAFDRLSPKRKEGLKGLRGRGLVLLALLPLFVVGGIAGSFAGWIALGDSTVARILGLGLALLTGFVSAGGAIVLIYRIFPPQHIGWSAILRGTAITASGISVLSVGYVAFISLGTNFQQHYATSGLAGIVLLAVWLFLANVLLLVGYGIATGR